MNVKELLVGNINKQVNIKKNFLFQFTYQILAIILPLISAPYISRVLGAEAVGIQSLTYNIANYFVILSMLGLATYGNRSIAKVKSNQEKLNNTFSELFFLHILISSVITVLYFVFVFFIVNEYKEIYLISSIYVIFCAFDINWLFFGLEEFKITVIRGTFIKVVATISIFIFIKSINDLWIYVLILASSTAISYLSIWPFIKGRVSFVRVNIKDAFKKHFGGLFLLFIPTIAINLYRNLSKIMIGFLSNTEQLGYFDSVEKIMILLVGMISALGVVFLPRMSSIAANKSDEATINRVIEDTLVVNSFLSYAFLFGIAGISLQFVPIFFGESFASAGPLLLYLSITIPLMAISNLIRMVYLIPFNKDKLYVISIISGLIINVILNFLLIKPFGAFGGVISVIISEFLVFILHVIFGRTKLKIKTLLNANLPFIFIGISMFIIIFFFGKFVVKSSVLLLIVQIFIGGTIYIALSFLYLLMFKKELLNKLFGIVNEV
jgi:O-antigen/teichoic acid export membrane protein